MAKDNPYSTGIFETITNVHFGEGLAVEFYTKDASYLTLPSLPDFSKTILSFWFRVPKATLDSAYNNWILPDDTAPHPLFNGITPLVVFGDSTVKGSKIVQGSIPGTSFTLETWSHNTGDPSGTYHLRSGPDTITEATDFITRGADIQLEPSFIGIDSNRLEVERYDPDSGDPPPTRNVLLVRLQMTSKAEATGMLPIRVTETFSGDQILLASGDVAGASRSGGAIASFGPDVLGNSTFHILDVGNPFVTTDVYGDATDVYMDSNTEYFTIKLDSHEVKPDRWHIVTLSLDLSGMVTATGFQLPDILSNPPAFPDHGSVSSTCKAWIAFDDVNYKGADIRDKLVFTSDVTDRLTFAPNGLYTFNSIQLALTRVAADGNTGELAGAGYTFTQINSGLSLPEYSYSPGHITTTGYPTGIPVTQLYASKGNTVEMGEFFMWTGKTLNTASSSARRLFVDDKGKPVNPKVAAKALGKPVIALHGSKKWIEGKSTGTAGLFDPTGLIIRYRPDPSLHGPQSPKK
jgi:hypothetical protein